MPPFNPVVGAAHVKCGLPSSFTSTTSVAAAGMSSPTQVVADALLPCAVVLAEMISMFCNPSASVSTGVVATVPGWMFSTTAACVPLMFTIAIIGSVSEAPLTVFVGAVKLIVAVLAKSAVKFTLMSVTASGAASGTLSAMANSPAMPSLLG